MLLVDGYEQGERVGETAYTARGPAWVTFARWWWTVCPEGRKAIVAHEIGHSVGHIGHGQQTPPLRRYGTPGEYARKESVDTAIPPAVQYATWRRTAQERRRVGEVVAACACPAG